MTALRYRVVLFDLDGTLVDSYVALADAVNYALRLHGLNEIDTGRIRTLVGHGIERLLQRACETEDVPRSINEAFEARYDEICCSASKVLDDVEPTLVRLANAGVAMAVCTNKPTSFSRKILDALNLAPLFRAIVGPDLAGARKPDALHVMRTLEEAGCTADGSLFVGDMPVDVAAARNSGIDVAVVATGSSSVEQLAESQPDYLLQRFSDLVQIVSNGAAA
jgi:phosphoglycolate phosphatase